jgi:hypothetical protein
VHGTIQSRIGRISRKFCRRNAADASRLRRECRRFGINTSGSMEKLLDCTVLV